jgi:hypothetical protein
MSAARRFTTTRISATRGPWWCSTRCSGLLRHTYGAAHVTYVRNITDIEDKIMDAAKANGESIADLTRRPRSSITTTWAR